MADLRGLNSLAPNSKSTLEKLSELDVCGDFVMVGGSALAIYLEHRTSEDIDLFTFNKDFDLNDILKIIPTIFSDIQIVVKSHNQLDLIVNDTKVTFRKESCDISENSVKLLNNLRIAELRILAIMKVNNIFLRAKLRDYYDLYVLSKEIFSIKELFEISASYIIGLNFKLFQQALIFTDDITDENLEYLNPKYRISKNKIADYFQEKLKKSNGLLNHR